jgi:guanosine-3',5'-bis(diphosphate) 3'-pyrophosphohydrolase
MGMVSEAREFALTAHGQQMYGDKPYSYHLDAVVELLVPYGETAQIVGYLHDVAEDTAITIQQIRDRFGDEVAMCASLVTDEPGTNRKERKQKTNAKLAACANDIALIVKAADRLANLRESVKSGGSKLGMYRREHMPFVTAAYRPGLCDGIWKEINELIGPLPEGAQKTT